MTTVSKTGDAQQEPANISPERGQLGGGPGEAALP